MSLRAILTGGIEGKGFCGEEKTTNFVLDALICNMLLLHHRASCDRSKFSFSVKDVTLLSELKIVGRRHIIYSWMKRGNSANH